MKMQTQGFTEYMKLIMAFSVTSSSVGTSIGFVQLVNHLFPTLENIRDDSCQKMGFSFQDCDLTQSQLGSALNQTALHFT